MKLAIELLEKHLTDEFDLLKFMYRKRTVINKARIDKSILICRHYKAALNKLKE